MESSAISRRGLGARLTVESDDTASLWSVQELVMNVANRVEIPVTFDYHHHGFTDRGLTSREGFDLARETRDEVRPITQYSESARLHGDPTAQPQDHAEFVTSVPSWLRRASDVMIEAHGKGQVVFRMQA